MTSVSGVGCDGYSSGDLKLQVVTPAGDLHGTFSAPCSEKVEQFINRLGLEKEEASGLSIDLLRSDQFLSPTRNLEDCGVKSGDILTLLRQRQSQLQLVAFGCGHIFNLDSFFSWVADDCSAAVHLLSGAVAWSRRFAEDVQDGSLAAVCSLQNPEWMQSRVDSGELSKSAAVEAILVSFIRSLLATGRLGEDGCGPGGSACEACDHEVVTGILREHLPESTRGAKLVNVLNGSEPDANLTELFMKYIAEKYPEKVDAVKEVLNRNLAGAFRLESCEELPMNIWSDVQDATVGWRQYLVDVKGSPSLDDDCCKDGWMGFLKSVHAPGSMFFQIKSDDEESYTFFQTGCMICQFAVGVYLETDERGPNTLPSHYIVSWARTD